jgi:hypothetical protein
MAVITLGHSWQVINILALSRIAIVTASAGTEYLEVVDRYRGFPDAGRVAVLADIGTVDMLQALAGGGNTIVATRT